ncbi:MAG: translation initiation factor IF-3 [Ignavibacteriae bacterium]|nr:translation initiation factor IF-3 [Ignavibacteriota bacterium]
MKDKYNRERVNQDITSYQVRVVDEHGNPLGVMPSSEALRIASQRGLDLVEISPNSKPPVCKVVDYGKFNYERQKKEKLAKKHQVVMSIKEVRFNANTDTHDVEFKTKHLRQFLLDGHKIKASVLYKGRMITHQEIGRKLMEEMLQKVTDIGKIEAPPKLEGKMLVVYLVPDKHKVAAYKTRIAKEEKTAKQSDETGKEIKPAVDDVKAPDGTAVEIKKEENI